MENKSPKGRDGSGTRSGGDMLKGLSRKNPKGMDSSGMRGGSVNSEPTRSGVGASVPVLGPRVA